MTTTFDSFLAQINGDEPASISGFSSFSGQLHDSQVQTLSAALKDSTITGIRLAGAYNELYYLT